MSAPEPPRWCRILVTLSVKASPHREALLGDLCEGYAERLAGTPAEANRWYRRQACSIAFSYLSRRRSRLPSAAVEPRRTGDPLMRALAADLHRAVRRLWRNPAFALVVFGTLAFGIGANTAIFTIVRGVLIKPLAYADPDRLIALRSVQPARDATRGGISRQDADDWTILSHSFAALGTYAPQQGNVAIDRETQRIDFAFASPGVFRALGVPPALGRALTTHDDDAGQRDVAVVSHGFWIRNLGAAPTAIGRLVRLNGRTFTVVGVMPASFAFPEPTTALWIPFGTTPDETGPRIARWVSGVGRLRPGASLLSAQREMDDIARRLAETYPTSNAGVDVLLEPQQQVITGDVRPLLLFAWLAVGVVLLIIAANVVNLSLARATAREPEVALLAALGASRSTLARYHLLESIALALAGGTAGIGVAALLLPALRTLGTIGIPRTDAIALDPWIVAYGLLLSLALGIVTGLAPALGAASTDPGSALRRAGAGGIGRGRERLRMAFMVVQIALAVVVLVGAGLLTRSFERLSRVDPGFSARTGIVFRIAPEQTSYPGRDRAAAMYDQLEARLRTAPGVTAIGAVNRLPLTGAWWTTEYVQDGATYTPGHVPSASYRVVTPGYFHAIGISLLEGRGITDGDGATRQLVVVVSRRLAEQAWPRTDPIGHRLSFDPDRPGAPWYTVVGVVDDVHTSGLADAPEALAYVSFPQAAYGFFGDWGMDVVLRTSSGTDNAVAVSAARRTFHELAPTIPLFDERPLSALLSQDLAQRHLLMMVLGSFAATATGLAGVGLFAVVAYGVTQRRRELGLRLALGAEAGRVGRAVIAQGLKVAALGIAMGFCSAAVLSRVIASMLYRVTPGDPMTYGAAAITLLLITLLASWIPARRAARLDPIDALRSE